MPMCCCCGGPLGTCPAIVFPAALAYLGNRARTSSIENCSSVHTTSPPAVPAPPPEAAAASGAPPSPPWPVKTRNARESSVDSWPGRLGNKPVRSEQLLNLLYYYEVLPPTTQGPTSSTHRSETTGPLALAAPPPVRWETTGLQAGPLARKARAPKPASLALKRDMHRAK